MNFPTCDICGHISLDVRAGIAEYPDGYKSVMRCADHDACRERVLEAGEEWPLRKKEPVA